MARAGASITMLIDRRLFLVTLCIGTLVGVPSAFSQALTPRVGLVSAGSPSFNALVRGLQEAGYEPGRTIIVDHQRTAGRAERYRAAIESVLRNGPSVIVVGSTHGLTAARALTKTVPIVAVDLETDPVASGFAASLARPGGNVTGIFLDLPEMSGKLLQLLKEAVPGLTRVAVLWDAAIARAQLEATEQAARGAGMTIHSAPVRTASDLEVAMDRAVQDGARALVALSSPLMRVEQGRIDELALRRRLPSMTLFDLLPNGNGFMSYGPELDEMYRRSASYVDRILKGARAGDLPVERPSRFTLAVNVKTAQALGLAIPPSLLLRADRVIGQ